MIFFEDNLLFLIDILTTDFSVKKRPGYQPRSSEQSREDTGD
jgi:hypothetical protein